MFNREITKNFEQCRGYLWSREWGNSNSIYFVSHRCSVGRLVWSAGSRPSRFHQLRLGLLCKWNWDNSRFRKIKVVIYLSMCLGLPELARGLENHVQPYGFLMSNFTMTSHSADTFGYVNSAAPTGASQHLSSDDNQSTTTFQVQQSRLGFSVDVGIETKAKFEMDFFSSAKSSPTVSAAPRLRIAKIETQLEPGTQLMMGQDWDFFSPLAPHTYNFIGNGFLSGNIGFMRQMLGIIHISDSDEWAVGFGLPVANDTGLYSNVELSASPSLSAKWSYLHDKNKYGLSLIVAQVIANNDRSSSTQATGLSGHADYNCEIVNLRAEIYQGQNLNNLGSFGLSQGRFINNAWMNLREFGFFFSAKKAFERFSLYGGVGHAEILNPSAVASRAPPTAATAANPLGVLNNNSLRLGIEKRMNSVVNLFGEVTEFQTDYVDTGNNHVEVAMLGMHLPF